jgi:hypothetical protein
MELKNYCLDLEKVNKIAEKDNRDRIYDYYQTMLSAEYHDKNSNLALNYFNTLDKAGYLMNIREEKIDRILS